MEIRIRVVKLKRREDGRYDQEERCEARTVYMCQFVRSLRWRTTWLVLSSWSKSSQKFKALDLRFVTVSTLGSYRSKKLGFSA